MKRFLRMYWLLGSAMLCVVLAYSGALASSFFFDDYHKLIEDERIFIDGWSFDGWRTAALSSVGEAPRQPLTRLSFSASYVVFGGLSPLALKAVNLLLHLIIAALVYGLALVIARVPTLSQPARSKQQFFALAAAAIWMLHPLHVSTILSVAQRAAQLSALFTLMGLLVFVHYRLRWAEQGAVVGELVAAGLWLALLSFGATWSEGYGFRLLMLCLVVEVTLFQGRWRGFQFTVMTRLDGAFVLWLRFPLAIFSLFFFLLVYLLESSQADGVRNGQGHYLASVGFCLLLAQLLTTPAAWNRKVGLWPPLVTLLGVLLLLLFFKAQLWADPVSLAQANVVNAPSSSTRARYFYADALLSSYQQRQAKGEDMNNDRGRELVVESAEHFLQVHEGAPADTPTLLMLLYVDSRYFPGMPQQKDWMSMLATADKDTAIEPRGLSALSLLLECVGNGRCNVPRASIEALLDDLMARNPNNLRLPILKYEYLFALGAPQERRMIVLERASAVSRNPYIERYRVLENGRRGDVAAMYEVVRVWLANDPQREDLPFIMPLFNASGEVAEPERAFGT